MRDRFWYKDAVIYEVHVRAFSDSDGDGSGDFQGLTAQARLPAGPGRHRALAAAVLPLALARRRLRHRRLHQRPPGLRHPRGLQGLPRRGPPARAQGDHRAGDQPHVGPAPLVPARPPGPARQPGARLLRLERHGPRSTPARASSSRTSRPRTGPGTRWPTPTTGTASSPTSRTSTSTTPWCTRRSSRPSTSGWRWGSTACGSTPSPISTSARARTARTCRRPTQFLKKLRAHVDAQFPGRMLLAEANQWPEDAIAYFGDPATGGDECHMAVPLPAHAAPVHGAAHGGPLPDHRHPPADAADPGERPSGRSSCATTTS